MYFFGLRIMKESTYQKQIKAITDSAKEDSSASNIIIARLLQQVYKAQQIFIHIGNRKAAEELVA